jgi:hypothetical protein
VVIGDLSVAVSPSNTAFIAARDASSGYWLTSYDSSSGISGWVAIGGVLATDPVVASSDSDVYLVGRDNYNGIWVVRYDPDHYSWTWSFHGGKMQGKPSATIGSDGALYITARDATGGIWIGRQVNDNWSGWYYTGGAGVADPQIVAAGTDLFVVVRTQDGTPFHAKIVAGGSLGPGPLSWTGTGQTFNAVAAGSAGSDLFIAARDSASHLWWHRKSTGQWNQSSDASLPLLPNVIEVTEPPGAPEGPVNCGIAYFDTKLFVVGDGIFGWSRSWATVPYTSWVIGAFLDLNGSIVAGPGSASSQGMTAVYLPASGLISGSYGAFHQDAWHDWVEGGSCSVEGPVHVSAAQNLPRITSAEFTDTGAAAFLQRGTTRQIRLRGDGLDGAGQLQVSGSGVTMGSPTRSAHEIVVNVSTASNASVGARQFSFRADGRYSVNSGPEYSDGSAMSNQFPLYVADPSPVITSVNQLEPLLPGGQAWVTICGTGFGAQPGSVRACQGTTCGTSSGVTATLAGQYAYWSNTQVNALLTASSTAFGNYDMEVTAFPSRPSHPGSLGCLAGLIPGLVGRLRRSTPQD